MKLKYLTFSILTDAAYQSALEGLPVNMLFIAPPTTGKTYSTQSLKNVKYVKYFNKTYSPKEYRAAIGESLSATKLLICDDLGLCARWNAKEYFSTFMMICDGEILFKQFKNTIVHQSNCSLILCMTNMYFDQSRDDMKGMGLLDRMLPIAVTLSQETRKIYQETINLNHEHPPDRMPILRKSTAPKNLMRWDIDPRWLRGIQRLSRFLTIEELEELIYIIQNEYRGEI